MRSDLPSLWNRRSRRMIISLLLGLAAGCGGGAASPEVISARRALQLAKPQQAVDALVDADDTAPARYLRGIALAQLDRGDAARAEIEAAIAHDDQPRYQAALLRLRLFGRDLAAADSLIELEGEHPSDAAVRLACVFAYEARAVRLTAQNRHEAAAAHHQRAAASLKTALTLANDIPEFHPELLAFAEQYGQHTGALRLVTTLLKTAPDDNSLQRRQVSLLLETEQIDEAIRRGRAIHLRHRRDGVSADLYASTLARAATSQANDRALRELRRDFPGRLPLITHHAAYLARNHRLTSAVQVLTTALQRRKKSPDRWPLIRAAITLPLQSGAVGLAEQQLNRYRSEVPDEVLVTYYEGQLLHLRKDYDEAIEKMSEVLRARVDVAGRRDPLVADAVKWLQRSRQAQSAVPEPKSPPELVPVRE